MRGMNAFRWTTWLWITLCVAAAVGGVADYWRQSTRIAELTEQRDQARRERAADYVANFRVGSQPWLEAKRKYAPDEWRKIVEIVQRR